MTREKKKICSTMTMLTAGVAAAAATKQAAAAAAKQAAAAANLQNGCHNKSKNQIYGRQRIE